MTYPIYYVEEDDTLPIFFDTFDGGTGASITLTGLAVTDIEIYKDGSATQRASDNGFTLLDTDGIDFDGITGIHGFSIDLSDNSDAGFYAVGSWYHVVVSSVTVDGQTVNFVAAAFRIVSATRGMAGTALPDAAADAAGGLPISDAGGLDLDAMDGNVSAVLTDTADMQPKLGTPAGASIAADIAENQTDLNTIITDTNELQTDWTDGGRLDLILDAVLADTNELQTDDVPGLIAGLNDPTAAAVADAVWDEARADHVADGSFGQALQLIRSGTAQAGTSTTITLDASASAVTNFYVNCTVFIIGGTGVGQSRRITAYNGTTKVATVANAFTVNPSSDSVFIILPRAELSASVSAANITAIAAAVWAAATRTVTAPTNITANGLAISMQSGTGYPEVDVRFVEGSSTAATGLSAAGIQYAGDGDFDANTTRIEGGDATNQINAAVDAAFTTQMADSVAADGAIATREQALYMILQMLTEFAISGTTLTVKKVDGSTTLMTFTLDDATNPTSLTRAS